MQIHTYAHRYSDLHMDTNTSTQSCQWQKTVTIVRSLWALLSFLIARSLSPHLLFCSSVVFCFIIFFLTIFCYYIFKFLVDICIWVLLDSRSSSWRLLVYFVTTFFSLYLNCCYLCDQIHSPLKCMLDVLSLHRITLAYLVYFMYTIYIRSRESIENRKKKKSLQWFVLCAFSATKENRLFNSVWEPWCSDSGVLNSINYDFYDVAINKWVLFMYLCMHVCALSYFWHKPPL